MSAACPAFGFTVRVTLADERARDDFFTAYRAVLDARGLIVNGDVVSSEASQATDADRAAIREWIAARHDVAAVEIGPLYDLRD